MGPYRDGAAPPRACPRCRTALALRAVGDDAVEECLACRGVFVRRALVPRVLDALDLGGEVLESFDRGTRHTETGGPLYVPCPTCKKFMNRRLFAAGAKVVVDECKEHGIWFDEAELRTVVEFAAGGGLERAAAEEERRAREKARVSRIRPTADRMTAETGEGGTGLLGWLMASRRR